MQYEARLGGAGVPVKIPDMVRSGRPAVPERRLRPRTAATPAAGRGSGRNAHNQLFAARSVAAY
jgi:hypothetical protein